MLLKQQYVGLIRGLIKYWKAYGGCAALITSPYLHFAILLSLVCNQLWKQRWWDLPIAVLPSLIGFTLGAYAILVAFGDEKFRNIIRGESPDGRPSPFLVVSATFVHFILMQILSLIVAIIVEHGSFPTLVVDLLDGTGLPYGPYGEYASQAVAFVGLTGFFYSIALAISAVLAVFQISIWYDMAKDDEEV